jgi:hypothetical protein
MKLPLRRLSFLCAPMLVLSASRLLAAASPLSEPVTIVVGDGTVSGRRLAPYTNRWEYSRTPAGGQKVTMGLWTDELSADTIEGRAVWVRKQVAHSANRPGQTIVTVNVFDAFTLEPVRREWTPPDAANYTRIRFNHDRVSIERMASGGKPGPTAPAPPPSAESRDVELRGPVYDYHGGMWGMIFAGAPLKVGLEGTFRTLDEFSPTVSDVRFKVVREEEAFAGEGRTVHVFVVEADSSAGRLTFWISPQAPYIIKLQFTDGAGALWSYDCPADGGCGAATSNPSSH